MTSQPSATTTAYGYGGLAGLFTSKERDAETGLDYFGARYMSSAQGRFTSPDPLMASAKASNPQTWNRYSYTLNNPLRFVDPDGLDVPEDCARDANCTIVVKVNVIYDKTANRGRGLTAEQKSAFTSDQIARAQKAYGTSNIKLDVSYTAGTYTVDSRGESHFTGLSADALNIMVSTGTPSGKAGASSLAGGMPLTVININEANVYDIPLHTNTTEHELAHQFLGDPFRENEHSIGTFIREEVIDSKVLIQGLPNFGIPDRFREGLIPRRYAAPANPEANKPQK
jgi:RHS repeat-associated protein